MRLLSRGAARRPGTRSCGEHAVAERKVPYMQAEISDYALLGDTRTAALVSRQGSIDWLCAPRFDSPAFLAAILGAAEHGRWLLAPTAAPVASKRSYRADTLILQTEYECSEGA